MDSIQYLSSQSDIRSIDLDSYYILTHTALYKLYIETLLDTPLLFTKIQLREV